MPRLIAVDLLYGPAAGGPQVEVRFTTTRAVATCDSAVLQLIDRRPGGSELGVRIARGEIVDTYLWDGGRRLRQRLARAETDEEATTIVCSIPAAVLPIVEATPSLRAVLIVNGGVIHADFPVSIGSRTRSSRFSPG